MKAEQKREEEDVFIRVIMEDFDTLQSLVGTTEAWRAVLETAVGELALGVILQLSESWRQSELLEALQDEIAIARLTEDWEKAEKADQQKAMEEMASDLKQEIMDDLADLKQEIMDDLADMANTGTGIFEPFVPEESSEKAGFVISCDCG